MDVAHVVGSASLEPRAEVVLARGCGWGAIAGAVSGAAFVLPLILRSGPAAALVIYPPLAAFPGAVIGVVLGAVVATVLVVARPATRTGARVLAGASGALCVAWVPLLSDVVLAWLWVTVLAATSGALCGPRVIARRNGAAAATGTASPGSSRAPGR